MLSCPHTGAACALEAFPASLPTQTSVVVIDADPAARAEMTRSIAAHQFNTAAYDSCEAFLSDFSRDRTGCIVLDWNACKPAGPPVLDRLTLAGVRLPIIVVTAHARAADVVQAFNRGGFDFFDKPCVFAELIRSVRRAIAWDTSMRCLRRQLTEIERRWSRLNEAELDLLALLMAGEANAAVAERLSVAESEVSHRCSALFRKLNVRSLAELAGVEAIRDRLVEVTRSCVKRIRFDGPHPDIRRVSTCPLWLKHVDVPEGKPFDSLPD